MFRQRDIVRLSMVEKANYFEGDGRIEEPRFKIQKAVNQKPLFNQLPSVLLARTLCQIGQASMCSTVLPQDPSSNKTQLQGIQLF